MDSTWLDLIEPSVDEVFDAIPEVDPDAIETLTAPAREGRDARPFLESHGTYVMGLFLSPTHDDGANTFHYREVVCVVTRNHLVTVRKPDPNGEVAPLPPSAADNPRNVATGLMLQELVNDIAEDYLDLVDQLYGEIDELEDATDQLSSRDARRRLSDLRHEMLYARKNVSATRAAVRRIVDGRLDIGDEVLFPREVERSFADTYDTLVRIVEELDVARDLLVSVRDFLQAKVSESQNEVVKILTVVASLVLVPTLITGFFGQNFADAFSDRYWSLTVSTVLIVVSTAVQVVIFRWRRWI